jgi:predicted nucleic acid-binding Zn ribbon protein
MTAHRHRYRIPAPSPGQQFVQAEPCECGYRNPRPQRQYEGDNNWVEQPVSAKQDPAPGWQKAAAARREREAKQRPTTPCVVCGTAVEQHRTDKVRKTCSDRCLYQHQQRYRLQVRDCPCGHGAGSHGGRVCNYCECGRSA